MRDGQVCACFRCGRDGAVYDATHGTAICPVCDLGDHREPITDAASYWRSLGYQDSGKPEDR